MLKNKLGLTNQIDLNQAEEKISKQKAKQLFEWRLVYPALFFVPHFFL